jgi:mitochondrial chaperone BCS1
MLIPTAIGTLMYGLKLIGTNFIKHCITSRMYSNITIRNSETDYFDAVLDFIQNQRILKSTHFMACKPKDNRNKSDIHGNTLEEVHYQPADTGSLVSMKYKGSVIYISRKSGETLTVGSERRIVRLESISLSVFGKDPSVIKTLISDAIKQTKKERAGEVCIFTPSWHGDWKCVLSKNPRSLDSVVLDKSVSLSILDDARAFLMSRNWYEDMGIPYRRGYLLYGPPGCGKTSFCQALAGVLEFDICILSLSETGISDSDLANLIRTAPLQSIVLIEDIDAVFKRRDIGDDSGKTASHTRITFSGLLNAIDGVASQEGRLLFMTTNHIEMLDPALIRPGRCDMKIMFRNASKNQLVTMFLRFFPGHEDSAHRFADSVPADELSPAQIQCHLVKNRFSAEEAIATAPLLIQQQNDVNH